MSDTVDYFGYGANRHPKMMKAIIGRIPAGYPATISGFDLCIQEMGNLPDSVQKILKTSWDGSFRSYVLRPSMSFHTKPVKGTVWQITKEERRIIDNWEMTGIWYKIFLLQYQKSAEENVQIEI